MAEKDEEKKTPVTIITGFLGAGKTTLVNHILQGDHGLKIAVIENEFGEVSIDDTLVAENMKTKENVVVMDNGCVCCTVRGDLIRALADINKKGPFDAVLLETTGLADPTPVALSFYKSAVVNMNFKLDAIVCLVDAKHVMQHLTEVKEENAVNESVQQVAFSDKIIVNKKDLVSPEELEDVVGNIKGVNSFAKILVTERSKVDLKEVLGLSTFSIERSLEMDPSLADQMSDDEEEEEMCTDETCAEEGHGHGHGHAAAAAASAEAKESHGHGHAAAAHGHGHGANVKAKRKVHDLSRVGSVGIKLEGHLDNIKFNYFMGTLLRERSSDLYRSKGVLSIHGQGATKFVFQGVHESINFGPASQDWLEGEARVNKMVFIGKDLDKAALREGFGKCMHVDLPEGWECLPNEADGRPYYVNQATGASQWEQPTA